MELKDETSCLVIVFDKKLVLTIKVIDWGKKISTVLYYRIKLSGRKLGLRPQDDSLNLDGGGQTYPDKWIIDIMQF